MTKILSIVLLCSLLSVQAWSMGQKSGSEAQTSADAGSSGDTVWVMRDDGSKSCEPTPKNKDGGLQAGADALKKMGVPVLESKKANDGMMHTQMCGAPTGNKNAYKIAKKDLKNAEAMGFQKAPTE